MTRRTTDRLVPIGGIGRGQIINVLNQLATQETPATPMQRVALRQAAGLLRKDAKP